jgi:hypothetical protein
MSYLRRSSVLSICLITCAALAATAGSAVAGGNRVTPGNFTGFGFDQCVAPSQQAMDRWLTTSPYWAVGIYISGDSRACPDQPNLTRRWISTQLRNGWRLLPLTVGPQAACSTRYKYQDDVKIIPKPDRHYAAARIQGRHEAAKTVRAAKSLGIIRKSTLWYDIEAFSISGTRCRESAISFLSGWTRKLHALKYVSGVYSSASSGIKMLDDIVDSPGRYALPDRVWIADWNGRADLASAYVQSHTWMPHKRIHQYLGGHPETHGGVTINIDSNFMSLGRGSIAPRTGLACGVGISRRDYHRLDLGDRDDEVKSLHCLLKRKGDYHGAVHGRFDQKTVDAVAAYQRAHHMRASGIVTLRTWTALLSGGNAPVLKYGSAGTAVRRVQRALNAAFDAHLSATGVYTSDTVKAVRRYQRASDLPGSGVVATNTWAQLQAGHVP